MDLSREPVTPDAAGSDQVCSPDNLFKIKKTKSGVMAGLELSKTISEGDTQSPKNRAEVHHLQKRMVNNN